MSDPFTRGCVVMRGGRYSVVWGATDGWLALLPVLVPRRARAHDVALDTWSLVCCGVPLPGAVIRARVLDPVRADGFEVVGAVPGALVCAMVLGVIRSHQEAVVHERWSADKRHRRNADERCVNLVAA